MFDKPISAPSQFCLRTTPMKTKPTPMVVIAKKSARTRSDARPTNRPRRLAAAAAPAKAIGIGAPEAARTAAA